MKTPDEIKKGLECCTLDCDGNMYTDCSHCPYYLTCAHCDLEMHEDALAYIEELEAMNQHATEHEELIMKENAELVQKVQQLPKWISKEKRLPEVDEWVLTYYGNSYGCIMSVLQWTGREWVDAYRNEEMEELITHWMPLPEPPTEV